MNGKNVITKSCFVKGLNLKILIDAEDSYIFEKYSTCTSLAKSGYTFYVICKERKTRKYIGMLHRVIMKPNCNEEVDHLNGNGLDNRKENLRIVNKCQNKFNRRRSVNKTKGVFFNKDRNRWIAKITANYKVITLGQFKTEEEAIKARLDAEKIYHKECAGFGSETEVEWKPRPYVY